MLELYMAYADYNALIDLTENLVRSLAAMLFEGSVVEYQGRSYDLKNNFERLSVIESVAKFNPDLDATKLRDRDYLAGVCKELGIEIKDGFGSGKLLIEDLREDGRGSVVRADVHHRFPGRGVTAGTP